MTEEQKVWEKRDTETIKAFAAFLVYRDLGVCRSFGSMNTVKPHEAPEKQLKFSINSCEKWSQNHEWVARCGEWDMYRIEENKKVQEAARERVVQRGIDSFDVLFDRWEQTVANTPQTIVEESKEVLENGTIVIRHTERMNTEGLQRLVRTRNDLDFIARRALGMPERYTESKADVNHTGTMTINKGYVDVSPDDWDEDENKGEIDNG